MTRVQLEERVEKIKSLYKKILEREADEPGLNHYVNSNFTVEEIEDSLKNSLEYAQLHKKESLRRDTESLGNKEQLIMGSTPEKPEHLKILIDAGIQAVLCLDEKVTYPTEWCGSFLHVPVSLDRPIPKEKMAKCLDYLIMTITELGQKTFIHSENGVERSPLILALYLVATQDLSFNKALRIVASKRKEINPRKLLLAADLLEFVYSYRDRIVDPDFSPSSTVKTAVSTHEMNIQQKVVVTVSDNMYLGTTVEPDHLKVLKAKGVKTIIDLNEKSSNIDSSVGSWFAHMKIPMKESHIERILPIILKTARKYMLKSPVYVVCSNPAFLFMFIDNYRANMEDNDVVGSINIEAVRKGLMG